MSTFAITLTSAIIGSADHTAKPEKSMQSAEGDYELPVDIENMIGPFEAAQILEVSMDELAKMRRDGKGPAYVAVVRDIVRYYPDVVFAYGDAVVNKDEYFPLGF